MYKASIIAFTTLFLASSTIAAPTPNSGVAPRAAPIVPNMLSSNLESTGCPTPNDLKACMAWISSERSKKLVGQVSTDIAAIKAKNDKIAQLNQQLAALRAQRADLEGKSETEVPDKQQQLAAIDKLIMDTKDTIDKLSSSSQMDMVQLQSIMNKYNQSVEMMTNILKKNSDITNQIIRNMGR